MKKYLSVLMSLLLYNNLLAQKLPDISFTVKIDSCTRYAATLINHDTSYMIPDKKPSEIISLIKKDNIEIGIRFFVNIVKEDEENAIIVKYIFYSNEDGIWVKLSSGAYVDIADLGGKTSIKVNGQENLPPDFYISYEIKSNLTIF